MKTSNIILTLLILAIVTYSIEAYQVDVYDDRGVTDYDSSVLVSFKQGEDVVGTINEIINIVRSETITPDKFLGLSFSFGTLVFSILKLVFAVPYDIITNILSLISADFGLNSTISTMLTALIGGYVAFGVLSNIHGGDV